MRQFEKFIKETMKGIKSLIKKKKKDTAKEDLKQSRKSFTG